MADCPYCLGEGRFGKITCDYCGGQGATPVERSATPRPRVPHEAFYDGRCAGCGGEISKGDQIKPAAGEDGWLGECCT